MLSVFIVVSLLVYPTAFPNPTSCTQLTAGAANLLVSVSARKKLVECNLTSVSQLCHWG